MKGCFFRPAVGLPPSWNRRPSADAFYFGCKLFDRHECLLLKVMLLVAPLRGGAWPVTLMRIFRAMLNLCINATVVRRKSCPDQPDMPVSPVQAHG
jgi:hypothetical protein